MSFDDHIQAGLAAKTRNLVHSVVLIGGIGLITAICAWILWGQPGVIWTFVALALLLIFTPRLAPELIVRMYGARRVGNVYGAPLLRVVNELATRAGLPVLPKVYVIPSPILNAFATGTRADPLLAITQGMLNMLTPRELTSVLAHEIAHVRHNDLWIMNLADTMSRLTHFMSMMGMFLFFFNLPILLLGGTPFSWIGIILLYFAPTAASLLQLGLSRAREYDADIEGAMLSGDPEGLASALSRIEQRQGRMWESIFMPGRSVPTPSLLRTHPPTEERVRRLLALRPQATQKPPVESNELGSILGGFGPMPERPRYHISGLWY